MNRILSACLMTTLMLGLAACGRTGDAVDTNAAATNASAGENFSADENLASGAEGALDNGFGNASDASTLEGNVADEPANTTS